MNWKKVIMIIIGLPLILCVIGVVIFFTYCALDSSGILINYNNYLVQKKLTKLIQAGSKEIKVSTLVGFDWDSVCAYPPYSYHSAKNKWSLVFEKNGVVVQEMQILRIAVGDLKEASCANQNAFFIFWDEVLNGNQQYFIRLINK